MQRIIEECRPRWVIGENVNGIRSMGIPLCKPSVESRSVARYSDHDFFEAIYARKEKMLVNLICEDLEKIGYEVQPLVIPACAVFAPHRRDRIWFIANSNSGGVKTRDFGTGRETRSNVNRGGEGAVVANAGRGRRGKSEEREIQQSGGTEAFGASEALADADQSGRNGGTAEHGQGRREKPSGNVPNVSDPVKQGLERHAWNGDGSEESRRFYSETDGPISEGRLHERGRKQWGVEPELGRVAYGIPDRVDRLTGLGNAVLPQIPETIGFYIKQVERIFHYGPHQ